MSDPKLFKLTDEDKAHYLEIIESIDPNNTRTIVSVIGTKIKAMISDGKLNSVEAELIDDIAELMGILEMYPDLPLSIVKKILFAMTYFVDENDEIPDVIPKYGYLDDIKVVEWVMDEIKGQIPPMSRT